MAKPPETTNDPRQPAGPPLEVIVAQQSAYIGALEQQVGAMAIQLVQLGCERDAAQDAVAGLNARLVELSKPPAA